MTDPDGVTRIRFEPPARHLSANDRMHWAKKAELTRAWREAAYIAACRTLTPAEMRHERCEVRVYFPVRDSRRRDPANWQPTCKAIVDGLVDASVWSDDTPEFVEVMEPRFHRFSHDVVIELTPEAAPPEPVWPNSDERELGMARVRELREQRARADHPTRGA